MKLKKLALVSGIGLLAGMTTLAHAVTPAGIIKNTAQLTYAGLTTPLEATVDITVTLVAATPNLSKTTADQTVASNTAASYTYQVTSTANGMATYSFTSTDVVAGLTGNVASTVTTSVVLGSTSAALLAPIGTQIKVPNDGDGDNSNVNGIAATDTVVIAGVEYTVSTVTEEVGDAAAGLLTITLTSPLPATVAVGVQILERTDITVAISDVGGAAGTITSSVKATTPGAADTADVDALTTVTSPAFEKWVRNTTSDNGSGTTTTACGTASATYYASDAGVTAAPGETLEYCIQVIPASTIATATVTDVIPEFTTYVSGVQFGGSTAAVTVGGLASGVLVQSTTGAAAGDVVKDEKAGVVYSVTVDI
ncbi:MAG: hypothetical protein HRU20_10840 [Pseudomonadales bacterium]|nr:hypothetical protein [Pseudomonadales bacterium]